MLNSGKHLAIILCIGLLTPFLAPAVAPADILVTAGGQRYEGRVTEQGDTYVLTPAAGGTMKFPKAAVRDVIRSAPPAPAAESDLKTLVDAKKVEVQTQGSGIQRVTVRVRRLVPEPLTVRIPVGTYFVSRSASSQNMVSTAEARTILTTDEWVTLDASAACTNRTKGIPGSSDTFSVQHLPDRERADLAKLVPVLDRAGVPFAVRQAAIWIVTDNATYGDLGSLVGSMSRSRVIREEHAARAMQLCEEAGINIRAKAIWRDRDTILQGLQDGAVKTWLQQQK